MMTTFMLLLSSVLWQSGPQKTLTYLGQESPGETAQVFAPGIISTEDEYEYGSVFSKDGLQFYYGVALGNRAEIRMTQVVDGKWTKPKPIISHEVYGYNDPFLSMDEKRLYFITDQPSDGKGPKKQDHDIYFVEKQGDGWSKPKSAGPAINTKGNEYYMSFTNDGSMYFASNIQADEGNSGNLDIYVSAWKNKAFQKPVRLSNAVNTGAYEADVYVAPDESYLIFCATRREGLGRGDLYISFKGEDGKWTKSVNMGKKINSEKHELCPFVSRDGRYFFYTSNKDIYWVDASILQSYRR